MILLKYVTLSFIIYCILITTSYLICYRSIIKHSIIHLPFKTVIFILLIFCTFAYFTPDFLGHLNAIQAIKTWGEKGSSLEPIHIKIIQSINYDNIKYRFCLYCIAFICIYIIAKKYVLDTSLFFCIYVICCLFIAANIIRSNICDCICFVGILAFFYRRKLTSILLLLISLYIGIMFHKSAFMIIIPLMCSIFIRSKKLITFLLISFPILILIGKYITSWIFDSYFENSIYLEDNYYLKSKLIKDIIKNIALAALWVFTILRLKSMSINNNFLAYIYRFLLFSFVIYLSFFFFGYSHYVRDRFSYHCLIPLTIALTWIIPTLNAKRTLQMKNLLLIYVIADYVDAFIAYRDYLLIFGMEGLK